MIGDPDLLKWFPLKDEFAHADPMTSTYTSTYRLGSDKSCCDRDVTKQKYVPFLGITHAHRGLETTYRYDMGQYKPHRRPTPTVRSLIRISIIIRPRRVGA